ncbi:ATP-dependent rRNA helicase SPB4 [Fusarium oxysporum f. sp. albedinis]|nr:ATP-dependent rRNA helicase SPB4 [Fusarium oxysporum f. sp. albedinis]
MPEIARFDAPLPDPPPCVRFSIHTLSTDAESQSSTCLGFLVKTPPANKMQLEGGVGEIGNPRLLFHQLRLLALLSVSALQGTRCSPNASQNYTADTFRKPAFSSIRSSAQTSCYSLPRALELDLKMECQGSNRRLVIPHEYPFTR